MDILIFFLVLFLLILVHEWGHFIAAKRFGIRVDEFGLGFPPKLFGWKKPGGETEYTFNLLPIGGFVKIFGEDPDDESIQGPDRDRSFVHKPKWQQAIVLIAGVTMNIVLAWVLYVGGYLGGMPTQIDESELDTYPNAQLVIAAVIPDSPAAEAGVEPGDAITAISGVAAESRGGGGEQLTPSAITDAVAAASAGATATPLTLTLARGEESLTTELTPEVITLTTPAGAEEERPAIGIQMSLAAIKRHPPHEALWLATERTWELLGAVVVGLGGFLASAATGSADLNQVTGPVGIVNLVGDASALGFAYLVTFTAFISLNLAVINLLPFPALDGGRLLFVLIEKLKGSPIKPAVANAANTVGFVLLLLLMLVVTVSDVVKLL
ncbi:PDZ domain-containing protein [Patescibacteria group bacterium]|jgi:regulator of sigma E protease|nr:PDZ domain-containing protein [Patescibacteria group bacterium]